MNIKEARETLSDKLWDTPWIVTTKKTLKGPILVIKSNQKTPRPKRGSRKMRTWHKIPVMVKTRSSTRPLKFISKDQKTLLIG